MTKCVFCPELGVATAVTTTLNEAFPFLCTQLGLSSSLGGRNGGGGGGPSALCSSCHSLWEEVSVLYSNMQGLLNLMARRVQQFKKNIDKGYGHKQNDGHSQGPRTRGRKRNTPPPDEESMLSWWYPSASDSKRNKKGKGTEKGVDAESIRGDHMRVGVGTETDIKIETTDVVEEIDFGETHGGGGGGQEVEFEDFEIFPEGRESDGDDEDGADDTKGDPSYDPLQSSSPPHASPAPKVDLGMAETSETVPVDFGVTQRNKPSLFYNNFSYGLDRTPTPPSMKEYWKCRNRTCYGRLIKVNGTITISQEHTCLRSAVETEVDKLKQELKSTAIANPMMKAKEVVSTVKAKAKYSEEAIKRLPNDLVLCRNINRFRNSPRGKTDSKTRRRRKYDAIDDNSSVNNAC